MKTILAKYLHQEIGMNIEKPLHVETVKLTDVQDTFLTVTREKSGNTYHLPFLNIVKIIENPEGVLVGGLFKQKHKYPLVVKIGHLVDYVPT